MITLVTGRLTNGFPFLCPHGEESGGAFYFTPVRPFVRPFVRPNIDTWFVRLFPPTVLELQL